MNIRNVLNTANCESNWKTDFDGDVFNIYRFNSKNKNHKKSHDKVIYISKLDECCMIISQSYANKMCQRIREFNDLLEYLGLSYVNNYVNGSVYNGDNPVYKKLNTNNNFRKLHGFPMIRNRKIK
ncbi:MAG TPA: hypothetical protein DCW90_00345 [Lachnospiraceae bacterium]|nr:hypothetical protein [Lachnospiraceae bacterium]